MRYRKKPVEIQAWQWDGDPCSLKEAPEWVHVEIEFNGTEGEADVWIETLEGNMTVSPGDYIVKGVFGELYPCKPNIFEATYEAI